MSADSSPMMGPVEVIERALSGETDDVPSGYSANALVLWPSGTAHQEHVCGKLLSVFAPVNLLGVAIKHDPDYYRRLTAEHMETPPARLGVVDVGAPEDSDDPDVATVSEPGDLTGVGISVTHFVKRWADAPEPIVVCFDALTPLLQYSEMERVYRFLDVTTRRLNQVCAVSHAHVNPLAHDDQTLHQLMSVFDAAIEPASDDPDAGPSSWSVNPT